MPVAPVNNCRAPCSHFSDSEAAPTITCVTKNYIATIKNIFQQEITVAKWKQNSQAI